MLSVTSGKVLVTGANGFIAMWIMRALLQQGYSVRGTVRSENKAAPVLKHFADYSGKVELVIVPDMTVEGAFDEAVKGVSVIVHAATPVDLSADDPDDLIIPAVRGTTRVLEAALKYASSVQRVLYTSSCAAITVTPQETPRTFSEKDWADDSVAEVQEKGRGANPINKYAASKVLAERAAWDFVEKHKSEISWDLVAIHPPWVFGPTLFEPETPEELNSSNKFWYQTVFNGLPDPKELGTQGMAWIDVRDLAEAHVLAIKKAGAGGQRIIVASGLWKWQDWINAARKHGANATIGDQTYDAAKAVHLNVYDTTKASRILGIKYRSMDETTTDLLEDFQARGWIALSK